jgi:Zn-dependent protease
MNFDEGNWRNLGLRAGRIRGVDIWIQWLLLIVLAAELIQTYLTQGVEWPFPSWLVISATLLLSVFLHEVGHWVAASLEGGGADRIILGPLGGLAVCDAPQRPGPQLRVAAGGLVVNAFLIAAAAAVCLAAGWRLLPILTAADTSFPALRLTVQYIVLWNTFLLILNLLPCLPLDGGRIFQAAAWARLESQIQGTLIALRLGMVVAAGCLVAGLILLVVPGLAAQAPLLVELRWGFIFVACLYFIEYKTTQHRLAHGEEDEGIFGYDFSRGYTSLERTATRRGPRGSFLRAVRERRRARALAQKRERERLLKERVDMLLEKISREGMESLSRREQRFLSRASKALRK